MPVHVFYFPEWKCYALHMGANCPYPIFETFTGPEATHYAAQRMGQLNEPAFDPNEPITIPLDGSSMLAECVTPLRTQ